MKQSHFFFIPHPSSLILSSMLPELDSNQPQFRLTVGRLHLEDYLGIPPGNPPLLAARCLSNV